MTRMMQGYKLNGEKIAGPYHGDPHEYSPMCDAAPECRPASIKAGTVTSAQLATSAGHTGTGYRPPPTHYRGDGLQPWDVVDAFGLDYYLGTVIKYVCRAGKKDIATKVDDLRKAADFLHKAIELEQKNEQ